MISYRHYTRTLLVMFVGILLSFLSISLNTASAQEPEATSAGETSEEVKVKATSTPEVAFVQVDEWFKTEGVPANDSVYGDFVIGPGKTELEIAPGESKTVMLSVTNRIGRTQTFNIEVEDMQASSDPNKTIELLGNSRGPYTLKDYVTVPGTSFELDHNRRARIPVTISIPSDAEPGGRYGSVLVNTVTTEGKSNEGTGLAPQSPIVARIGSLFFLTITGETHREAELKDFVTVPDSSFFQAAPITLGILFENTGSIHLAPYGTLSITNMLGDEVGYVELEPWFSLPNSLRLREVIWDADFLFGRYTATIEINRGYDNMVDTMDVTFLVLPWKLTAGIFVGIFFLFFITRIFFRTFEFKRK